MEEGELRVIGGPRADLPGLIDDAAERTAIEAELARALDQPPGRLTTSCAGPSPRTRPPGSGSAGGPR